MSWQPSAAAGLVFIGMCLLGSLIIELRRHYPSHNKAMHLRVDSLMADKTNGNNQEQSCYDNDNDGHRAPRS